MTECISIEELTKTSNFQIKSCVNRTFNDTEIRIGNQLAKFKHKETGIDYQSVFFPWKVGRPECVYRNFDFKLFKYLSLYNSSLHVFQS